MPRLKREDRERQIIAGAISFFAQHGFSGRTRDLARELGITQPLLYRYFSSKQSLIDRVYEELFLLRWDPAWPEIILDRRLSLEERLRKFYLAFCQNILTREWVRMFVLAGLEEVGYNKRVLNNLETNILRPLCVELRICCGYVPIRPEVVSPAELEYAWELHGIAFYYHIRKYVYGLPTNQPLESMVDNMVDAFLGGAPEVLARTLGPEQRLREHRKRGIPAA